MHEQWKELIKPEHKLLDIGCWDGKRILELKDRCDVYGLDIDKTKFLGADEAIKIDCTKEISLDLYHLTQSSTLYY